MLKYLIPGILTSTALLLGTAIASPAQMSAMDQSHSSASGSQFRQIDHPIAVYLAVTTAGLTLLGLELWWFLGNQPRSQK